MEREVECRRWNIEYRIQKSEDRRQKTEDKGSVALIVHVHKWLRISGLCKQLEKSVLSGGELLATPTDSLLSPESCLLYSAFCLPNSSSQYFQGVLGADPLEGSPVGGKKQLLNVGIMVPLCQPYVDCSHRFFRRAASRAGYPCCRK